MPSNFHLTPVRRDPAWQAVFDRVMKATPRCLGCNILLPRNCDPARRFCTDACRQRTWRSQRKDAA